MDIIQQKKKIYDTVREKQQTLFKMQENKDRVYLSEYKNLVSKEKLPDGTVANVWSNAFDKALSEHKIVIIPASDEKYYISRSVIMSSGNGIIAEKGAVIRLLDGVKVLMVRNKNVIDGSFYPEDKNVQKDKDLFIIGGRWEEYHTGRAGYLKSGRFDDNEDWLGVSTAMLFSNVENLLLKDIEFYHTAGFAIQIGNLSNFYIENITFEECFADGVHINGRVSYGEVRDIRGYTGDDLVALNMYDWANSGINFGPLDYVVVENLYPSEESPYKSIRLQPGTYYYDDGTSCDCSINNLIMKNVNGIENFKMYLQLPAYKDKPEESATIGSGNNIFFEDIDIDLKMPIDKDLVLKNKEGYRHFAAFEICSNIDNLYFENVNVTMHKDSFPESSPIMIGPKSSTAVYEGNILEVFMPDTSCTVNNIYLKDFKVNGVNIENKSQAVNVIEMHKNADYPNTLPRGGDGKGIVKNIEIV